MAPDRPRSPTTSDRNAQSVGAAVSAGIPIERYRPLHGDHLCSVWTDPATDRETGRQYLLGAAPDERAIAILDRGRGATRYTATESSDGPMLVFTTDEVHVEGGVFDPGRMRRFWRTQADRVGRAGGRHLRAVAEMAWALRAIPGTDGAPVFESSLNPVFGDLPASVICQYGSTHFPPETVLGMLLSHPLVVIGGLVHRNPFHVPHEEFERRFDVQRRDPEGALYPIWRHFLAAQASPEALARFVCNSLPTLLGADHVLVSLRGMAAAYALAVEDDRIEMIAASRWRHRRLSAGRTRVVADGQWGTVHAAAGEQGELLTASLDLGPHAIAVTRRGGFSDDAQFRFVLQAWDIASTLRRIPAPVPTGS